MRRLRVPAGVVVRGESFGGRFVTPGQLVALAQRATLDAALRIGEVLERRGSPRVADLVRIIDRKTRKFEPRRRDIIREEARERITPEVSDIGEPPEIDVEWEVGIEYLAAHGHHHNVDVNIRFARDDGQPMDRTEAQGVFQEFRRALSYERDVTIPEGYHFAAVNWRRPSMHAEWRGGRHAGASELLDLIGPLVMYADEPGRWNLTKGAESDT